jgi:hypothetical protein
VSISYEGAFVAGLQPGWRCRAGREREYDCGAPFMMHLVVVLSAMMDHRAAAWKKVFEKRVRDIEKS